MGYYVTTTGSITLHPDAKEAAFTALKEHDEIGRWLINPATDGFDELLFSMFEEFETDENDEWDTIIFSSTVKWRQAHLDFFEVLGPFIKSGEIHCVGEDHAADGWRWADGHTYQLRQTWEVVT